MSAVGRIQARYSDSWYQTTWSSPSQQYPQLAALDPAACHAPWQNTLPDQPSHCANDIAPGPLRPVQLCQAPDHTKRNHWRGYAQAQAPFGGANAACVKQQPAPAMLLHLAFQTRTVPEPSSTRGFSQCADSRDWLLVSSKSFFSFSFPQTTKKKPLPSTETGWTCKKVNT